MNGIEFKVLWWDNEQSSLNDLGIRPDISEADTRLITFYSIDNISPYTEGGKLYTAIKSGGEEYIIPEIYLDVQWKLQNHKQ